MDLAIATALLCASGQLRSGAPWRIAVVGELTLAGSTRPVNGALAMAEAARQEGAQAIVARAGHRLGCDGLDVALVAWIRICGSGSSGGGLIAAPEGGRPGRCSHGSAVRRRVVARPSGAGLLSEV